MNRSISQQQIVCCCIMIAMVSATVLFAIAPHLIAIISYFFILLGAIVSINRAVFTGFALRYLILCLLLLSLAFFLSVYSHADYSATQNVTKLLYLSLPVLFLFSQSGAVRVFQTRVIRVYIPRIFYLLLIGCFLQVYFEFAIKNIMTDADIYAHISQLNDLVIATSVFVWLISAITVHQLPFGKHSIKVVLFCFLILAYCVFLSHSAAAILALATGGGAYVASAYSKNKSLYVIKAVVVLFAVFFILVPKNLYQLEPNSSTIVFIDKYFGLSALHRVDIWEQTIDKIQDRPLSGWGNSDSKYLDLAPEPYRYDNQLMRPAFSYPHNIFLQVTLELGIFGLAILLAILNLIITAIYRLHQSIRPYTVACFVTVITIWMLSYPLWRSWWLVFICLLAGGFYLLSEHQRQKETL